MLGDSNPEKDEEPQGDVSQDTPRDESVDAESEWLTDKDVKDDGWEEDSDYFYMAPQDPKSDKNLNRISLPEPPEPGRAAGSVCVP